MRRPLRVALVGFGKIARDQHLPVINAHPRFECAGVVDPEGNGEGLPHAPDLATFLASGPPIDAVALCTPPRVRCDLARQAIAAGKHVLLEKPPGASSDEVIALLPAAHAAGVTLFTAWHSRYAAAVSEARQWLVRQRAVSGRIQWQEDFRVWHPGQEWIWRGDGMGVFDPGINALSILTDLTSATWVVERARLETPANAAAPVRAELDLRGEDGLQVNAVFDFLHEGPPRWDLSIWTDAGELMLSSGGARMSVGGAVVTEGADREYAGVYGDFAELIESGRSEVDVGPLQLVEQAIQRAEHVTAPPISI
jgi:D-galactose 1-dehydrogenase